MQIGNPNLNTAQRDILLARAQRLDQMARHEQWAPRRRFARVASRLRRFVAGRSRYDGSVDQHAHVTERHISGQTSYAEWIEELRWCGVPAQLGHTRLSSEQKAARQANLDKMYPRIIRTERKTYK